MRIIATEKTPETDFAETPVPRLFNATELDSGKPVEWLAMHRIPRGAVSLLCGDEGIGKSLLWILIVAAITKGHAMPEFGIPKRQPANVILVLTEDDWSSTVEPRLIVAGADISRIQVFCTDTDGSGSPIFPRDLHVIESADTAPVLVIFDAWLDTVDSTLSLRDSQQARKALHPFKEAATRTGVAMLLLVHTNRLGTANARDNYGISAELRKKARMSLYSLENEDGRLVVGPEKANMTKLVPATIFGKQSVPHFTPTPESDGTVPKLIYHGDSDSTIREQLADAFVVAHESNDTADAQTWLTLFLGAGPRWKTDIDKAAAPQPGLSDKRLRTAKSKLKVEVRQAHDGTRNAWFWGLPQHFGQTPSGPS
jgi:hypothetical protein